MPGRRPSVSTNSRGSATSSSSSHLKEVVACQGRAASSSPPRPRKVMEVPCEKIGIAHSQPYNQSSSHSPNRSYSHSPSPSPYRSQPDALCSPAQSSHSLCSNKQSPVTNSRSKETFAVLCEHVSGSASTDTRSKRHCATLTVNCEPVSPMFVCDSECLQEAHPEAAEGLQESHPEASVEFLKGDFEAMETSRTSAVQLNNFSKEAAQKRQQQLKEVRQMNIPKGAQQNKTGCKGLDNVLTVGGSDGKDKDSIACLSLGKAGPLTPQQVSQVNPLGIVDEISPAASAPSKSRITQTCICSTGGSEPGGERPIHSAEPSSEMSLRSPRMPSSLRNECDGHNANGSNYSLHDHHGQSEGSGAIDVEGETTKLHLAMEVLHNRIVDLEKDLECQKKDAHNYELNVAKLDGQLSIMYINVMDRLQSLEAPLSDRLAEDSECLHLIQQNVIDAIREATETSKSECAKAVAQIEGKWLSKQICDRVSGRCEAQEWKTRVEELERNMQRFSSSLNQLAECRTELQSVAGVREELQKQLAALTDKVAALPEKVENDTEGKLALAQGVSKRYVKELSQFHELQRQMVQEVCAANNNLSVSKEMELQLQNLSHRVFEIEKDVPKKLTEIRSKLELDVYAREDFQKQLAALSCKCNVEDGIGGEIASRSRSTGVDSQLQDVRNKLEETWNRITSDVVKREDFQKQLVDLRSLVVVIEKNFRSELELNATAREELKNIKSELKDTKSKLEVNAAAREDFQSRLTVLQRALDSSTDIVKKAELAAKAGGAEIDSQVSDLCSRMWELEKSYQSQSSESRRKLELEASTREENINALQKGISEEMSSQLQALQAQILDSRKDMYHQLAETKNAVEDQLAENKGTFENQSTDSKRRLEDQLAETKRHLESLESTMLMQLLSKVEEGAAAVRKDMYQQLQETKGTIEDQLAETKGSLEDQLSDSKRRLEEQLALQSQILDSREDVYHQLAETKRDLEDQLAETKRGLEDQITDTKRRLESLESAREGNLKNLKHQLTLLKTKVEEGTVPGDTSAELVLQLQDFRRRSVTAEQELRNQLAEARSRIELDASARDMHFDGFLSQLAALRHKVERQADSNIPEIELQLGKLGSQMQEAESRLAEFQSHFDHLKESQCNSNIKQIELQLGKVASQMQETKQKVDEFQSHLDHSNVGQAHQEKLELERRQVDDVQFENLNSQVHETAAKLTELLHKFAQAETETEAKAKQFTKLQRKFKEAEKEREMQQDMQAGWRKQIEALHLEDLNTQLHEKTTRLENQLQDAMSKLAELQHQLQLQHAEVAAVAKQRSFTDKLHQGPVEAISDTQVSMPVQINELYTSSSAEVEKEEKEDDKDEDDDEDSDEDSDEDEDEDDDTDEDVEEKTKNTGLDNLAAELLMTVSNRCDDHEMNSSSSNTGLSVAAARVPIQAAAKAPALAPAPTPSTTPKLGSWKGNPTAVPEGTQGKDKDIKDSAVQEGGKTERRASGFRSRGEVERRRSSTISTMDVTAALSKLAGGEQSSKFASEDCY